MRYSLRKDNKLEGVAGVSSSVSRAKIPTLFAYILSTVRNRIITKLALTDNVLGNFFAPFSSTLLGI